MRCRRMMFPANIWMRRVVSDRLSPRRYNFIEALTAINFASFAMGERHNAAD